MKTSNIVHRTHWNPGTSCTLKPRSSHHKFRDPDRRTTANLLHDEVQIGDVGSISHLWEISSLPSPTTLDLSGSRTSHAAFLRLIRPNVMTRSSIHPFYTTSMNWPQGPTATGKHYYRHYRRTVPYPRNGSSSVRGLTTEEDLRFFFQENYIFYCRCESKKNPLLYIYFTCVSRAVVWCIYHTTARAVWYHCKISPPVQKCFSNTHTVWTHTRVA